MSEYVTVIGGVNMDISAALTAPFVPADSVPGQVTLGCGGVARNIAHNLRLIGHEVKFVTKVFDRFKRSFVKGSEDSTDDVQDKDEEK